MGEMMLCIENKVSWKSGEVRRMGQVGGMVLR